MPGGRCGLFPSLEQSREENMSEEKLLALAIQTWGEDAQTKMVLEEMSELQKEICKRWRGKDNIEDIADEVADVEIMLDQLKMMLGIEHQVSQHRKEKMLRLKQRLGVSE